jgi:glutamate-1-semialdehyde 2,1-aminomutase
MNTATIGSARESFEARYRERTPRSEAHYAEALRHLAGGVPGDAAFRRPYPLYIREAHGSRIVDIDGNDYLDLLIGGGPHILGHSPAVVVDAVEKQLRHGTSTLAPPETAVELAQKIKSHMPHLELLRYVTTGSEANHVAMRIARAYTGRTKIAKFEGNFHGGYDNELVSGRGFAGPADAPEAVADGAGIPASVLADTVVLPYNDADVAKRLIEQHAHELAAVVIEPIAGTWMGGVVAQTEFLQAIRAVTEAHGILLIFDEVVTGFRVGLGGAAGLTGVTPDLTALAKIIGGGFPLGAVGGRREIMERTLVQPLDPAEAQRKAFHSGTFQSNLIGLVAGLAVIGELEKPGVLERINGYGDTIRDGLRASADRFGLNLLTGGFGSIVSFHFGDAPVRNMREVAASDRDAAATFCLGLIANGIFITTYHLGLTNGAQTDADIDFVLDVAADVFEKMSS